MQADLVKCTTQDGVTLDGAFFQPQVATSNRGAVDAMLLVHGSGGSFLGALQLYLADRFRQAGYPAASFNTTGHDLVWGQPGHYFGNAFEILDRCRIDLDAAIAWLAGRGYQRIGILGHSMGAVKVVYYQAHTHDPRVAAVIAASPVRLSHTYFLKSEAAEEYRGYYEKAVALVDSGQPDALFPVNFPMPHLWSAAAYIDKHGPQERYNVITFTSKVNCPLLLLAGALETHPRLRDAAKDAYATIKGRKDVRLVIAEGADHGWAGQHERLFDEVLGWLGKLKEAVEVPGGKE
ncbi:MAG: alpha/beta fold hydrolase [Chloroflexi bacterium]|nr:alpha/beta fold hydrolase [Chloroflexota bacterium]